MYKCFINDKNYFLCGIILGFLKIADVFFLGIPPVMPGLPPVLPGMPPVLPEMPPG